MKTQYYTASSLDGFIADADNSLDWLMQFGDPEQTDYPAFIAEVGAIAMGATTYRWLWEHAIGPDAPKREPWPYEQPTWVFTHRGLPVVEGADVRLVSGDVRPVHAEMARVAGGKNVWVCGGGELAGQFYDAGLLDEVLVTFAPVTLGGGAPLLPRRIATPGLRLVGVAQYGAFASLRYEVRR
ncbi:MAG: dihydrofolate reductase family protein [Phycisphaerae bacterium]|nr:dihydrofolate reductase family protein [Tepidisphaeraceae bacterium]